MSDNHTALEKLDTIIERNDKTIKAHRLRGFILYNSIYPDKSLNESLNKSLNDFNKVLDMNPNCIFSLIHRASILTDLLFINGTAVGERDRKKMSEIIEDYTKIIELWNNLETENKYLDKEYGITLEIQIETFYFLRGFMYQQRALHRALIEKVDYDNAIKDYDNAIKDYDIVIQTKPNFKCYYHIATCYSFKKNEQKHFENLSKAIEMVEKNKIAYPNIQLDIKANKLSLLPSKNRIDKNIKHSIALCYFQRGKINAEKGRYHESISDFTNTIENCKTLTAKFPLPSSLSAKSFTL